MNIEPIETNYNGYRFRSRLEARWAVFFDSAEIRYEYEPEGYQFSSGEKYLPDFYLPDTFDQRGCLVEIKPLYTNNPIVGHCWFDEENEVVLGNEANLMASLINNKITKARYGIVIYGSPWLDNYHIFLCTDKDSFGLPEENLCTFAWCKQCSNIVIGDKNIFWLFAGKWKNCEHKNTSLNNMTLLTHYSNAKKARFEYGEKPIIIRKWITVKTSHNGQA